MQDKRTAPEEIVAAIMDTYQNQDEQYYNYLYDLIAEIPLLNLWDTCYLFARVILYEGAVPNCIKDLNSHSKDELEPNSEEESDDLKIIQQWLSEQLVKSIYIKEINPKIVGQCLDGKIDTKRTYVDAKEIDDWLLRRNINANSQSEYFYYDFDYLESYDRIYEAIMDASKLMAVTAYNPDFKIPNSHSTETKSLLLENAKLRAQIHQTHSRHQNPTKAHGNAERFAQNREQVLGAALSAIIQWPDRCQNSLGKFEATKIATLIDEKSPLYWPKTAEPPLTREKMEREISKWIKMTGK